MKYARELTALVLSPIAIYIIGWSHPYVFDATIALIASLALYEFLILGRRKGVVVHPEPHSGEGSPVVIPIDEQRASRRVLPRLRGRCLALPERTPKAQVERCARDRR